VLGAEARRINDRFIVAQEERRPFVLLKAALTLDGRIATASGDSRWITSGMQRRQARELRRLHDAVLVGIGTALVDDPLLLPSPRVRRPFVRVILDSNLRLPVQSRLVRSITSRSPVLVLGHDHEARRRALEAQGVRVLRDGRPGGRLRLSFVLQALWKEGIRSVMVEGGSEVLGSFLAARLFDEIALFRAPILIGGRGSRPAFGGPDRRRVGDAVRLRGEPLPAFELWYPERSSSRTSAGRRTNRR
jgi:diaminohydroxyphosphoribosylaminopyrimidine deaminase / 5-amino-6-(5-phosphoribosylamino)uracil reductase